MTHPRTINKTKHLCFDFLPFIFIAIICCLQFPVHGQKQRARDIGIPFAGTPGKFNAITDVKGVEVGYSTIISGKGKNIRGKGPVRTGVTAILPRGK
ncbi:MAG: P1 family peptidase, partial [Ferruginibacter sp.]